MTLIMPLMMPISETSQESATENSQGSVTETSQESVTETSQESPTDTNQGPSTIDFSNVHLPVKARSRGRPKGAVKRVIGLPKRSQKEKDGSSDPKPRKRGRPVSAKDSKDLPTKKHCGTSLTLHLSKIPGSSEWTFNS